MIRECGRCGTKYNDDSVGSCPMCWNINKDKKNKTGKVGYLKKGNEKINTFEEERVKYFGK